MGWWKYSAYEIRHKRICPKPGASLEGYEPWAEYELNKSKARESPPYVSLLNLLNEIRPEVRFEKSTGMPPVPEDIDLLPEGPLIPTHVHALTAAAPEERTTAAAPFSKAARRCSSTSFVGLLSRL